MYVRVLPKHWKTEDSNNRFILRSLNELVMLIFHCEPGFGHTYIYIYNIYYNRCQNEMRSSHWLNQFSNIDNAYESEADKKNQVFIKPIKFCFEPTRNHPTWWYFSKGICGLKNGWFFAYLCWLTTNLRQKFLEGFDTTRLLSVL